MAHYVVNDDGVVTRKIKKKDKEKNLGAFGSADIVTRPKPSTLKTVGSTIRNTGMLATEGAVKDLEGKLDTANKLSGNINDRLLHVANTVIFGKDKADEQLKKDKKNQREFIERDLTKEAAQNTGFDKEQQEAEEDSVVKRNNFGGQMAYGIGQMLPNVAIGRLTGLNLKGKSIKGLKGAELAKTLASNAGKAAINQLPSTLSLGSSSYGNAYESALQQGYSEKQANDYALANAAIESGTEMITGGIPGTNGVGALDDIAEKGINKVLRGYGRAAAKTAGRAVGEGSEEKIGTYLDALARQNILGEKQNWKDVEKESNQAFLLGGAIGGVLNAPQIANDIRVARNENLANKLTAVKGFNEVERSALTDITRRIKAGENINANDMATIQYLNSKANQTQRPSISSPNNVRNINNEAQVNDANNRVQQIQQAVQNGQMTNEQGIQEIQNITNSLTNQNQVQNQPIQAETTQLNTNTQETQNVAQQPNKAVNEYQEPTARQMTPEEVEEMSRAQTESLNRMAETEGYNKETPGEQLVQNNNVSDRKVKAVQYENPEIKPYYKEMAEFIADEAHEGANMAYEGGLIQDDSGYGAPNYRRYGGWNGLLGEVDEFAKENHMTARQVEKAAQDIIEDDGKENNANAKKVEQLIDKRLRNGFTYMGDKFEPNQDYINKMEEIAYEKQRQGELESLEEGSEAVKANETTQNNNENKQENIGNSQQEYNEGIKTPIYKEVKDNTVKAKEGTSKSSFSNENVAERKSDEVISAKTLDDVIKDFNDAKNGLLDGKKLRSYVETSNEATGNEHLIDKADVDKITYEVQSNKETYEKAQKNIKNLSYEERVSRSKNLLNSNKKINAVDMAEAQIALLEAAQSGRTQDYLDLQQDIAIMGTELGQAVQAMSMIQKMSPDGQISTLLKIVNRKQAQGNRAWSDVELNPELVQKVLDSYDDASHTTYNKEQMDEAVDELKQDIADQMKVSKTEKLNEWRYLSMLGNPKTHIRNLVGNVAMSVVKSVKDLNNAALQDIFIKNVENKTATLKRASKDVKNLSDIAFEEMMSADSKKSKYSETGDIEQKRKIFNNKALEALRKGNLKALNVEDNWFKSAHFKKSFSNYLTAKGINTIEDINNNPQIIADAKNFAMNEAKIATFQQENRIANWIRDLDNLGKGAEVIRGAIVPFTGVPLNIAKTGIEYTPGTGMLKTISDFKKAPSSQKASVLIDGISKQMTGTALTVLGYALAQSGIVTADAGDDKDDKFEKDIGAKMNYSIKIGNKSYDFSWLSPSSMPFFVGASAYEQWEKKEGLDANFIFDALASTIDPLSEMSVISSFTKVMSSYEKDDAKKLKKAGESTVQSYISQYIPTVFSQFSRTLDSKKRNTYADKNSPWTFGEETLKQVAYKTPFRTMLPEQTDYLGRTKKENENVFVRGFEAFLSPASVKQDTSNKVTKELMKLYKKTGNTEIIPGKPDQYIDYKDEKYDLTQKEYNKLKRDYGTLAAKEIDKAMNNSEYKKLSKDKQAQVISNIMKYSKFKAKENYFTKKDIDYTNTQFSNARKAEQSGYAIADYYISKQINKKTRTASTNDRNRYQEVKAFGVSGKMFDDFKAFVSTARGESRTGGLSKKQKVINYIQGLPLTADQKEKLYEDYKNNQGFITYYK